MAAKQEFVTENEDSVDRSFSSLYDFQRKYVGGLMKQLPSGTTFPSPSRSVNVHPPRSFLNRPSRQGPFLLQPSPVELKGSPGGDASDILYVTIACPSSDEDDVNEYKSANERLDVVVIAFQDGRVDICLDLEKVEAKWETKKVNLRCSQ